MPKNSPNSPSRSILKNKISSGVSHLNTFDQNEQNESLIEETGEIQRNDHFGNEIVDGGKAH